MYSRHLNFAKLSEKGDCSKGQLPPKSLILTGSFGSHAAV